VIGPTRHAKATDHDTTKENQTVNAMIQTAGGETIDRQQASLPGDPVLLRPIVEGIDPPRIGRPPRRWSTTKDSIRRVLRPAGWTDAQAAPRNARTSEPGRQTRVTANVTQEPSRSHVARDGRYRTAKAHSGTDE
jgi:hypothetical protein